jgi:hypothetical protein
VYDFRGLLTDDLNGHLVCLAITDDNADLHGSIHLTQLIGVEGVDEIVDDSYDALDEELQVFDSAQFCDLEQCSLVHMGIETMEDDALESTTNKTSSYATDRSRS